jgi:hypothetical protein
METKGKVIIVKSGTFYVNKANPQEVSYGFVDTAKWKPIQLDSYVNMPPDPKVNQVKYVLDGNPLRAAYELL